MEGFSSGLNLETWLRIDTDAADKGTVMWTVESLKFSVKQLIETVVTKDELHRVIFICKSEIDSMGRIVAGIIRLLKLERSIGNPTLNQLTNLGSRGFENMFASEQKPNNKDDGEEGTMVMLEEAIVESQARCEAVIQLLEESPVEEKVKIETSMKQLTEKLEQMQALLKKLSKQH